MSERVVPKPDERSAPYWAAAAEHRLVVARCPACGVLSLPPTLVCAGCGTVGADPEWAEVSGRGTVRSWTVVRQSFVPGFDGDLPFVLVDVELPEQAELRLIGRYLDGVDAPLALGQAVEVGFEDVAEGVAIPAWRRPTSASAA